MPDFLADLSRRPLSQSVEGSIKHKHPRTIPIHPHVIEQGFLDYVATRRGKPLFYDPVRARGGDEANRQADKVGERLASWVRKTIGITDPVLQPNHAWRHRFRTIGRSVDIETDMLNAIDGHAAASVADAYGDYWASVMLTAISKHPRYEVSKLESR